MQEPFLSIFGFDSLMKNVKTISEMALETISDKHIEESFWEVGLKINESF